MDKTNCLVQHRLFVHALFETHDAQALIVTRCDSYGEVTHDGGDRHAPSRRLAGRFGDVYQADCAASAYKAVEGFVRVMANAQRRRRI